MGENRGAVLIENASRSKKKEREKTKEKRWIDSDQRPKKNGGCSDNGRSKLTARVQIE